MPAASPYASRSGYRLAANLHAGIPGYQATRLPGYQATRLFALDAKFSAECCRWGFENVAFWMKSGIQLAAAAHLGLYFVAAQGMLSHSSRKMASNGKSLVVSRRNRR